MKLTGARFATPLFIGGKWYEALHQNEGYVEELDFPWCRVHVNGAKPVRTTMFNLAGCDDFEEPAAEKGKGK